MAQVVAEYISDGSSAEDGVDGFKETAVYIVSGLSGQPNTWMDQALNADGLPQRFQAHPVRAGIIALRRPVTLLGQDRARVSIIYGFPQGTGLQLEPDTDPGTIELGATVQAEVVTTDYLGQPITVTYDKQTVNELTDEITSVADTQAVEVEKQTAHPVFSVKRVESVAPFEKAIEYVGTVNQFPFLGKPARTWLCTGITAQSTDRGATYEVTYSFAYKPDTWDFEAVYILDEGNRPPVDLIDGRGRKRVRVQGEADLRQLNVSF